MAKNTKQEQPAEQEEMDKRTAEEILGFDPDTSYSQKDMTEKYHQMVSERVADGADENEMSRVDHAKAYLDSYFVEDPTASLVSEHDINSKKPSKSSDSDFSVIGSALEATIDSMDDNYEKFAPPSLAYMYSAAHGKAARKLGYKDDTVYDVPELDGDYPLWFQTMTKFILRFPWRLAFALIVGYIGFSYIFAPVPTPEHEDMSTILGQGFSTILWSLLLLAVIAVNSIWGIVTNLIRHALDAVSTKILEWQLTATCKKSLRKQMSGNKNGSATATNANTTSIVSSE